MTSSLHEQRLADAQQDVRACGARSVLDLGCGNGDLLVRLAVAPGIERIVELGVCGDSLGRLRARLDALGDAAVAQVELVHGSMIEGGAALAGFDCAVLIETIEHIAPGQLAALERSVFGEMGPGTVVVTTPNAEFNALLGVPTHRFRHPDHRFEWDRPTFRRWAEAVAMRNGYTVTCRDSAGHHPALGGASRMAVFSRVVAVAVSGKLEGVFAQLSCRAWEPEFTSMGVRKGEPATFLD